MLNKLIVYDYSCHIFGISYTIGNIDSNKGRSDSNKGRSDSKMGSGGDWLNSNAVSSGYYFTFPWYSTGGSFYSQKYSEITFSPFREYYTTSSTLQWVT
jgi:hypothetical protein